MGKYSFIESEFTFKQSFEKFRGETVKETERGDGYGR